MSWPQLAIHLVCVGTPIALGVRCAGSRLDGNTAIDCP
jgi:hypothetical protein